MSANKPKARSIRVVLAFDQALVSAGTSALLERIEEIEVVGQAATAKELIENLKSWKPDVVLLDIMLAGLLESGLVRMLSKDCPLARMIVLTDPEPLHGLREEISQEAAGLLSRNASLSELVLALRTVASGGAYSSPDIDSGKPTEHESKLTRRQTEVLELVARGHTTREIGAVLGISVKTVETYRAQIAEKLDIHTLAGLVRYAIEIQLIEREE